jgi:hypothetical protein
MILNNIYLLFISSGESCDVKFTVFSKVISTYTTIISFAYTRNGETFHILRILKTVSTHPLVDELMPSKPYVKPTLKAQLKPAGKNIEGKVPPRYSYHRIVMSIM